MLKFFTKIYSYDVPTKHLNDSGKEDVKLEVGMIIRGLRVDAEKTGVVTNVDPLIVKYSDFERDQIVTPDAEVRWPWEIEWRRVKSMKTKRPEVKVGQIWKTRGGFKVNVVRDDHDDRPWKVEKFDGLEFSYLHRDGKFYEGAKTHEWDLMELIEEVMIERGGIYRHKPTGEYYILTPTRAVGMEEFTLVCLADGCHWNVGRGFDGDENQFEYVGHAKDLVTIED